MKITPETQPPPPNPLPPGSTILMCSGKGGYTIVDTDLLVELSKNPWYLSLGGYIATNRGKYLHHRILPQKPGFQTDHINGLPWDNRRVNLRYATKQENMRNRATSSNNTSGHAGVRWEEDRQRFRATIIINRRFVWQGRFRTIKEAIIARQKAELIHFKEFTRPTHLR